MNHLAALPGASVPLAPGVLVLLGDVLARLADVTDESVQAIVTSPPYLDARDYGVPPTAWPEVTYRPRFDLPEVTVPAQTCCLGHEPSLLAYVGHLVLIARELRRVLRRDGTLWLNIGAGYSRGTTSPRKPTTIEGPNVPASWKGRCHSARVTGGLPAKQLIPAPSAACDALQAEGWFVRNRIAWTKADAKPDSVPDRCTPAHEPVFLLTREPQYFFDAHAISTPAKHSRSGNVRRRKGAERTAPTRQSDSVPWAGELAHPRDVWAIPTGRFKGAHFATFPKELARKCVLAGTSELGCCGACGAPWRKLLSQSEPINTGGTRRKVADVYERQGATGALVTGEHHARVHVGWTMTCRCPLAPPVPCVVLDPFAGSGTTLAEAHALGVDAQPDYVPHMHERMSEAEGRRALRSLDATTPIRPRKTSGAGGPDPSGPLFAASTPRKAGPL